MSRLLPATLAVAALLLGAIVWELQDVAGPDPGTAVRALIRRPRRARGAGSRTGRCAARVGGDRAGAPAVPHRPAPAEGRR